MGLLRPHEDESNDSVGFPDRNAFLDKPAFAAVERHDSYRVVEDHLTRSPGLPEHRADSLRAFGREEVLERLSLDVIERRAANAAVHEERDAVLVDDADEVARVGSERRGECGREARERARLDRRNGRGWIGLCSHRERHASNDGDRSATVRSRRHLP